ncbi:expressed unknown protein [Seminavis robusta]|uniref:Cytochrome b561 domain-containing protein n=1 Tax=Seminavis robusta TaxID=568900 RepID=A0A9N8H3A2_9STRA|nr:expressed unknown protein [Seminavis robusta]|eukprot:Sro22_g015490.1 n/a (1209) ;mRNA; r:144455-148081
MGRDCLVWGGRRSSYMLLLLLCMAVHVSVVEGSVTILNATAKKTASIDNANYDYQVVLENTSSDPLDDVLIFRWDEPADGILSASLEHTTKVQDNEPSWLAIGFFDSLRNTVPIFDNVLDQVNGQAVVGTYFLATPAVFKYSLGDPHGRVNGNNLNGGVSLMSTDEQTLIFQNMEQGAVTLHDGTPAIRTILTFSKNMDEASATGNTNNNEALIRENGENIFTWAIGPPGMDTLGMHDQRGSFRLDFQQTHTPAAADSPNPGTVDTTPVPAPPPQTPAPQTPAPRPAAGISNIVNATATLQQIDHSAAQESPYSDFDFQVQLDNNLIFYWANPGTSRELKARLEHKAESMATAPSWLSLGFYDVPSNPRPVTPNNFLMNRSTAIIGKSWEAEATSTPIIYKLGYNHDQPGVIQPLPEQTLSEASFLQFTNTNEGVVYTTLSFTKSMTEQHPTEPPILGLGDNVFIWAMGPPGATALTMHSEYGAFRLDLYDAASSHSPPPGTTPAPVASISIIDGTTQAAVSTDPKFDFQVQLEQDVIFRWESPDEDTGIFTGRLVHTTKFVEAAPAWLGFGFPNPADTSTWMLMQNTYAVIGLLPSEKVEKYSLGVNNNHTTGFVQALPLEQQTLKASKMMQSHDPDTGVYTTSLTFAKLLKEDIPLESEIWVNGENRFLWAVGNALTATPTLGMHRDFGAMTVDFAKVVEGEAEGQTPATVPAPAPQPTQPQPQPQSTTESREVSTSSTNVNPFPAPVIVGRCSSEVFQKSGKSIQLTPELVMHWTVNAVKEEEFAEFGEVPSITVVLQYKGQAWLGFGIQDSSQAHGTSSTGIIGLPKTKDSPQLKYNITAKSAVGTVPMADQTLIEAYINQERGNPGLTTLRFTKALQDGLREIDIKPKGLNYFSFAVGSGNEMGYHRHRGAFQLDLSECVDLPPGYNTNAQISDSDNKAKGALTAHAIMAAIAWGFSMPLAVGMAWFRQLIPTTWIYVHVSFNLLTFLLTLLAVLVGVAAVSSRNSTSHFSKGHHVVGVLLFLAYTFQVGNGFLRPPVARKEDGAPVERQPFSLQKPQSAREWWHMIHRSTGIIMLLVGVFQIASGMHLYDQNFRSGRDHFFWYWTYVSLFALTLLALRIWLVMQNRRARGEGASWMEDSAATSVGIDPSDPTGMRGDVDCVVLEIPSRTGDSTMIRGARRMQANAHDMSESNDDDNMTVEIT